MRNPAMRRGQWVSRFLGVEEKIKDQDAARSLP